jgi:hypothetical protein
MMPLSRTVALAALLAVVALPARGQGTAKQQAIDPLIKSQLWPQKELSPTQQEYKDRVVAMRDTVTRLKATIEQVERARRSRTSTAVLASATRVLGRDCGVVRRNAQEMRTWAAGLSTDDPRFGEPAVRAFRSALERLERGMGSCAQRITTMVATDAIDPDRVLAVMDDARGLLEDYERAAKDLTRTLDISIEPTERS